MIDTKARVFKIDKGVPIPEDVRYRPMPYPFDKMQPGDSFLITMKGATRKPKQVAGNVYQAFTRWRGRDREGRKHLRIAYRVDSASKSIRVWLIQRDEKKGPAPKK